MSCAEHSAAATGAQYASNAEQGKCAWCWNLAELLADEGATCNAVNAVCQELHILVHFKRAVSRRSIDVAEIYRVDQLNNGFAVLDIEDLKFAKILIRIKIKDGFIDGCV
jgi:hypothetical protein